MIPTLNADDILDLPLSTKEKSSTSRNRLGYHVFLSWYFGVFKAQTEEGKRAIVSEFVEDDEDSVDSTITPPIQEFTYHW